MTFKIFKRQNKIRKLAMKVGDEIAKEVGDALEDRTITSSEFESILNKRRLCERSAAVIMTGCHDMDRMDSIPSFRIIIFLFG